MTVFARRWVIQNCALTLDYFFALQPDEEYPAWLWGLLDVKDTREELLREANALFDVGGYDEVLEKMDEEKLKRLFRLDSRERIRTRNSFGSINF